MPSILGCDVGALFNKVYTAIEAMRLYCAYTETLLATKMRDTMKIDYTKDCK